MAGDVCEKRGRSSARSERLTVARASTGLSNVADYLAQRVHGAAIAAYGVAVVAKGEVATAAGGERRLGFGEAVTTRSPFHICSCSKAFAALLFDTLVREGAVSWDASVLPIVPEFELADPWTARHCTFRDLAGMRVGLTRDSIAEWGFRPDAPVETRLRRVRDMRFVAPFRDRFSYSNLNYIALATAAARIAGAPYHACLERLVLGPLKLVRAEATAEAVHPHMPIAGQMTPVPELTGDNSHGSARVYLSAEDAAVWLDHMLQLCVAAPNGGSELFACQSVVRPRSRSAEMPSVWGYGFGWMLAEHDGRQIHSHGGGGRGWRAMTILDAEQRTAVMVMLAHEGVAAEALAFELLDLVAGRSPRDWYAGFSKLATYEAKARNATLDLRHRSASGFPPHGSLDGLYANSVAGRIRMTSDKDSRLRFSAEDAPAFDAILAPLADNVWDFRFDNPALSRMPNDPLFQARFVSGHDGSIQVETTYFGTLAKLG